MPGTKRPGDDEDDHHRHHSHDISNKIQRIDSSGGGAFAHDHSNGDFSGSVKKKIAGSSRTGQACDRCKIRKIRCDARPGGCSPCLQNDTECKTTDRITGRATSRGHTELVETENTTLKLYMAELQQQLRDLGVDPKPAPSASQGYIPASNSSTSPQFWGPVQGSGAWSNNHQQAAQPPQQQQTTPESNSLLAPARPRTERKSPASSSLLPDFRAGCIGDNYLGVSSETNWLSPIEGTSLALFGTKIDIAEFMPSESDPASTALSYQTFLNHAFGRTKPIAPPLPAYEQCKVYADWYFRSIQQFLPLIHKPHFMDLLTAIHHQGHKPSPAETVMVHMVLTTINFQFSARNGNEQARHDSMSHYHYALSFIPDLITSHKLEDIQALAVICSQLRSQPRPGAAWMFINLVMGLAIESGLHRSAEAWAGSLAGQSPHQLEMRKRIFWSLISFHIHISGKLGRPMPLRVEDFDIEMPDAVFDHLPSESDLSDWRKCSWRAGIEGFKMARIMMQIYSSIYSIKSTGQYEINVQQIEKDLDSFVAQVPVELRGGSQTRDEDRISALYLDISVAECQLLLHHPSLCRTGSPQMMTHNLDVCLHWSGKLLAAAVQLKELKSLDTTWYYSTDFIAAIFTTLFTHTERRDQMTSSDLQRLREDMDSWLDVMGEIGNLFGTGPKLQNAIRGIIDFALNNINRHIAEKTASAAVASTDSPPEQDRSHQPQIYDNPNHYNGGYNTAPGNGDVDATQTQSYIEHHPAHNDPPQHAYQTHAQYGYPDGGHANGMPTYNTGNMSGFDANGVYGTEDVKPNLDVHLAAHNVALSQASSGPTNFMTAFHTAPGHSGGFQHSGPAAWRNFADSMMTNMSGHEYMTSAGALMALSGGKPSDPGMDANVATLGSLSMGHVVDVGGSQPWPLIHYNTGGGNGTH